MTGNSAPHGDTTTVTCDLYDDDYFSARVFRDTDLHGDASRTRMSPTAPPENHHHSSEGSRNHDRDLTFKWRSSGEVLGGDCTDVN